MTKSLAELTAEHPINREHVNALKTQMISQVRAYRLRELREQAGLTQLQLAERMGVGQRQVSKIELGDLDNTKLGTIRSYLTAVQGHDDLALGLLESDSFTRVA